ncbi:MAG: hypothetical protein IJ652_04425, partial [Bacteroidales bacterium]|nr:hypothetical protein [Bacteroidales bacterium]
SGIKEKEAVTEQVVAPEAVADALPDEERLRNAWQALPKDYADRPRLANTLSSARLDLEARDGMEYATFYVVNTAQQQWIQEKLLHELEGRLQVLAGSKRVRLLVSVMADEQVEEKPYLPKDQAIELMAKHPEVKSLVTDFDLDTRF